MKGYKYLIVGGGMTADAAVRGILETDKEGSIGLIGGEVHPPYDRPPLSKALWKGERLDAIWRHTPDLPVEMHLGKVAQELSLRDRQVTDNTGETYSYDKLLLATGCTPRRLPFPDDGVIYFRTLDDYQHLRRLAESGNQFVVVGGGFIGSEIAAALAMNGKHVTMIFPEKTIGGRLFPSDLGKFVDAHYRTKGVEVLSEQTVISITRQQERLSVETSGGRSISGDAVVAGLGVLPNLELGRKAGLKVADGIVVDQFLKTTHPDVYAAGDVAFFHNPALNKSIRVEHEDNANTMGRAAGRNMAGENEPYQHLPSFYSDLFELGYEAVGEVDNRLETIADWVEPNRKGVIYYLHEERIRGVLLWNVWQRVDEARALIEEQRTFHAADLKGRIVE